MVIIIPYRWQLHQTADIVRWALTDLRILIRRILLIRNTSGYLIIRVRVQMRYPTMFVLLISTRIQVITVLEFLLIHLYPLDMSMKHHVLVNLFISGKEHLLLVLG